MPLRHVIPAVETLAFKPDAGALTVAVPTFTLHTGVVLESWNSRKTRSG